MPVLGPLALESRLYAVLIQRAEIHRYTALCITSIANADEYDVALVTLNVFQVLDEERLGRIFMEESFMDRVVPAQQFQRTLA